MRKWYVVFANKPQDCVVVEDGPLHGAALKRFDDAATLNMLRGTGVIGMWIIDHSTQPGTVIKCHGRVDPQIRVRHTEYLARNAKT
jgi:hypothetical protein